NSGGVGLYDFVPVMGRSGISGLPARRRRRGHADLNSRKIGINENHSLAVAYFPGSSTHVSQGDLWFLRRRGWRDNGLRDRDRDERERHTKNDDATKSSLHGKPAFSTAQNLT